MTRSSLATTPRFVSGLSCLLLLALIGAPPLAAKKRQVPTLYFGKAYATAEVPGTWIVDYLAQGAGATTPKVREAALCASITLAKEEGYDRLELLDHGEGKRAWGPFQFRGTGARSYSVRVKGYSPSAPPNGNAFPLEELHALWTCKLTSAEKRDERKAKNAERKAQRKKIKEGRKRAKASKPEREEDSPPA